VTGKEIQTNDAQINITANNGTSYGLMFDELEYTNNSNQEIVKGMDNIYYFMKDPSEYINVGDQVSVNIFRHGSEMIEDEMVFKYVKTTEDNPA
jgi:hypothetical protein